MSSSTAEVRGQTAGDQQVLLSALAALVLDVVSVATLEMRMSGQNECKVTLISITG